jgi:hypothetical protein
MKTHQVAVMLGNRSGEIVEPEFPGHSAHELEGMKMATHEGLEALAVRELHIESAAVTLDQAEGIKLARIPW